MQASLAWYPITLGYVFILLLAPLTTRGKRAGMAGILVLGSLALLVLAVQQASEMLQLDVVNAFRRGADGELHLYVTARSTAPGWQWPTIAAIATLIPALLMWIPRRVEARVPSPALYGALLGVWIVAVRLMLEQTAAPAGLVWAVGVLSSESI